MFAQYDDFDFVPRCHVSIRRAICDCDLSPFIIDSGLESPTGRLADVSRPSAIPPFFETKESGGVQNRSEKNRIVVF
jgi:hypothetical protein